MSNAQEMKIAAAAKALEFIQDGMRLGIGTGSTANEFIRLLSVKVSEGMHIRGVPTSERSAALCKELGVPITTLDEMPELDLAIDGADEIGPELSLIKGGGGALLREKIVAAAAHDMLVIADGSKIVDTLGAFPLPIEVNAFGVTATRLAVDKVSERLGLQGEIRLRQNNDGSSYVTDGGHLILDASFEMIPDPNLLSNALYSIPGVVEHGLFLGLASKAIIVMEDGSIRILESM